MDYISSPSLDLFLVENLPTMSNLTQRNMWMSNLQHPHMVLVMKLKNDS